MGENICRGYSIVKILGRGAYGEVSKVTNTKGDEFASKITTSIHTFPQVLREIDILKRVNHPSVLSGRDFFFEGPKSCVILDLMEGDIVDIINSGRLTLELSVEITKQIACGLNYLHTNRILHRDLKPDNVLFSGNQAKIADFGLSVNISPVGVVYQDLVGTREYCSPELLFLKKKKLFDYYYGEEIDNYAFGWVCMIILSLNGRINDTPENQLEYVLSIGCDPGPDFPMPRDDLETLEDKRRAYQRKIRWREGLDEGVKKMIFRLIQRPPRQRPTAKDVFVILGGGIKECDEHVEYPEFPKNIDYTKFFTREQRQADLTILDEIIIWSRKEFSLGNVAPSIELEAIDLYDRISMLFSVTEIEAVYEKIGLTNHPKSIVKVLAASSLAIDLFSTSMLDPKSAVRDLKKTTTQKLWNYAFGVSYKFNEDEWYKFIIEVVVRLDFRLFRPTLERVMPTKTALEIMKTVLSPRNIVL